MEEAAADLVFRSMSATASLLIDGGLARPAALGVGGEGLAQLVGEAEVVHDEAAGLVLEDAVDAGDGLHEAVAAHGLVDVHGVQAGRVEAGEPHVADDDDLEAGRSGSLKRLASSSRRALLRMCGCQSSGIGGGAGHDDLDGALASSSLVPLGAEGDEGVVEVDADAPAHADDHGLAVHGLEALLEVLDEVPRRSARCASRRRRWPRAAAHLVLSRSLCSTSSPSVTSSNSAVELAAARLRPGRAWPGGFRSRWGRWRRPGRPAGCRRC